MKSLTLPVKAAIVFAAALVLYTVAVKYNWTPASVVQQPNAAKRFDLPTELAGSAASNEAAVALDLPSSTPAARRGSVITIEQIPWNATVGLHLAVGGTCTTKGSLMEKRGLTVCLKVQDDSMVSQQNQVKFAEDLSKGIDNPDGPAFVIIMGDGTAQYLAGIQKLLSKLGPDYRAEVVGHPGYSRGEDGCWGQPEWKENPEAAKGKAFAAVLLDGDWNVCQYWEANSGLLNNPDVKTWDPERVNWFAAADFKKAVQMYAEGVCEDRPVVRNGRITNEPLHHTCVEGHATWTPGDEMSARLKGGLVRLLSTKENPYQMPAVLIGIHKWNVAHTKQVEDMLDAMFIGGAQVRGHDEALMRAAKVSALVYGDKKPEYWARYYKGTHERDKAGLPVDLGGSIASTLADNLLFYGLAPDSGGPTGSAWRATYEGFGNIAKQQYPKQVPSFPAYTEAFNAKFLNDLAARAGANVGEAEKPAFTDAAIEKSDIVAKRDWTINFDTGKDTLTPQAEAVLNDLYTQLVQGAGMAVELDGHTDNVGNSRQNYDLSARRAVRVKQWLEAKNKALFPANRVEALGFGDTKPVASNATAEGRAQNRRVTVVLAAK